MDESIGQVVFLGVAAEQVDRIIADIAARVIRDALAGAGADFPGGQNFSGAFGVNWGVQSRFALPHLIVAFALQAEHLTPWALAQSQDGVGLMLCDTIQKDLGFKAHGQDHRFPSGVGG